MSARRSAARVVVALVAAIPSAVVAQGFEYSPGTAQYRVTSVAKGTQEMMGNKQPFETSSNQLLTLTVARASRDTLAVSGVLDSISVLGPTGPTPGIDKLVGLRVGAKLSPSGAFYATSGPTDDSVPSASQIIDEVGRFLPRVRTTLANGASWADTSTGKVKQGPVDVDRRTIAKYTVTGDTTIGGETSWKIARETTTSLSGSGQTQNGPMTMDGTSNGKGTVYLSKKGVFLGGQTEDQASIKILLAANGMEVGVNTTSNNKIEKVK